MYAVWTNLCHKVGRKSSKSTVEVKEQNIKNSVQWIPEIVADLVENVAEIVDDTLQVSVSIW